jgi:hypothetical protein
MVVRAATQGPMELAVFGLDWQVVNAGKTALHKARLVKFPIFVSVAAVPVAGIVMPLVGKTHGNAVAGKGPQLLDKPVIQLLGPLAGEEAMHLVAPARELAAVTPHGILGVDLHHAVRVAGVLSIFGHAHFLRGSFGGEWGKWGFGFHSEVGGVRVS